MSKKMLINAILPEENRVAIVADGILTELDIEVAGREQTKGNIYKAVVVRVESGLQAAFVDYGAERLGFLQIDEINFKTIKPSSADKNGRGRPRINDLLHRGQEILVQIVKEERGTKGAALTTFLSLAGRYMVLMPDSNTRGVSRKAENDAQRKQLKKAMNSLELPENFGYIVRTAALDKTREELERDSRYLMRLYDSIRELSQKAKAPSLIYRESNLVIRSIRDYFTTDMDEVLIDDPEVYQEAKDFFRMVMPDHAGLVKLHQERRPIFARYQIEDQIETISSNKVNLPSGGSIVIDSTEALVAIDINSGKMAGQQGVEETATKTNLEAATEIGRQLRLRDLGGLIVIDFIDMESRKNIRAVENQLKESTASDKARINIGRISQFGLLEMSRQRIKATLAAGTFRVCPHCHGDGRIKSPEALAVNLLRRIHAGVAKGQIGSVDAQLPLEVASYLLNNKREELIELERRYRLQIHIHGRPEYLTEQVEIDFQKREKEPEPQTELVTAGMLQSMAENPPPEEKTAEQQPTGQDKSPAEGEQKPSPGRKRRRRGGRKRSGGGESQPAAAEHEAKADETGGSQPEAPGQPAEAAAEAAAAGQPEDQQAGTAQSPKPAPEAQADTVEKDPTASADEPKPAPKSRSRGRRGGRGRGRRAQGDNTKSEEQSADATEDRSQANQEESKSSAPATAAEPSQAQTDSEKGASSEPAQSRPRSKGRGGARSTRTTKPVSPRPAQNQQDDPKQPDESQKAGQETSSRSPDPAAQEAAAEPAKPKRRSPRRKTATKTAAANPPDVAPASAQSAETTAGKSDQAEGAPPPKPKPRRTSRSQAKPGQSEQPAAGASAGKEEAADSPGPSPADEATAKPKRRPARRKTAAAKTEEQSSTPNQADSPAQDAQASAAKAKPKAPRASSAKSRSRASSSKAESKPEPATDGGTKTESSEKPKKPRRAPRRKAEPADEGQA